MGALQSEIAPAAANKLLEVATTNQLRNLINAGNLKGLIDFIVALVGPELWKWYERNAEDVIFNKKVLGLFPINIRVKNLRGLFVKLLGEPHSVNALFDRTF